MIKPIGQRSIDRITSAQVITTITSGIKELLENSLDAGATVIDIKVVNQGIDGFSVQDNGSGIAEEDFDMVAVNHATSKISEFSDLGKVKTLGFRGEALASLCVMGDLEITTNTGQNSSGYHLVFDHAGKVVEKTKVPAPKGTLVEVSGLFAGLRARRLQLEQTIDSQYKNLLSLVQEYAMFTSARISVENIAKNQKHVAIRSQGSDMLQRIATVFRGQRTKQVMPVQFSAEDMNFPCEITGVLSKPQLASGGKGAPFQYLAVNSRPIKHKKLANVVKEVYRQVNPNDSVLYILDLHIDPSRYDVNVTPDKRSIMFHREKELLDAVRETLTRFYDSPERSVPRSERLPPAKRVRNSLISFASFAGSGTLISQGAKGNEKRAKVDNEHDEDVEGDEDVSAKDKEVSEEEVGEEQAGEEQAGDEEVEEVVGEEEVEEEAGEEEVENDGESDEQVDAESVNHDGDETLNAAISAKELDQTTDMEASHIKPEPNDATVDFDASTDLNTSIDINMDFDASMDSAIGFDSRPESKSERPVSRFSAARHKTLNSHIHLPLTLDAVTEAVDTAIRSEQKPLKQLLPWAVDERDAEERLSLTIHKQDFENMEIVGQFNLGFILVVNRKANLDDLFVIDQHASDEIYNFERLQTTTVLSRQPLVVPFPLELSAVEELLIQENLSVFENNGFSIRIDRTNAPGKQCFLTSVPYSKSTLFDETDVLELLAKLKSEPSHDHVRCSKLRAMFAMRACRSSIMIGRPLSMSRMREVVRHMGSLDKPWNCPHGRPTLRHITTLK